LPSSNLCSCRVEMCNGSAVELRITLRSEKVISPRSMYRRGSNCPAEAIDNFCHPGHNRVGSRFPARGFPPSRLRKRV
jgi:hypothetical protein